MPWAPQRQEDMVCPCSSDGWLLHLTRRRNTIAAVKTLTVRLPESLAAAIDKEARQRKLSKSDVVRERLQRASLAARAHAIDDLVGSVDALPADLSARKKDYLRATGYGRKRPR